jgi:hypothetical protein
MAAEIKGADIRKKARSTNRKERRFSYTLIDSALKILETHNAMLMARVYIKPVGLPFNGWAVKGRQGWVEVKGYCSCLGVELCCIFAHEKQVEKGHRNELWERGCQFEV